MSDATVTLASGRVLELREPRARELRGIKLLDLLQLDPAAHAAVVGRISDLTAPEFDELGPADMLAVMAAIAGFFAPQEEPSPVSPSASKTPGP